MLLSKNVISEYNSMASLRYGIVAISVCAIIQLQKNIVSLCSLFSFVFNNVVSAAKEVSLVVSDGNFMGFPSCQVHNCQMHLPNNRAWFCKLHSCLRDQCAVVGCEQCVVKASDTKHTCSDPSHQDLERYHYLHAWAHFRLKERLQKARLSTATNSETPHSDFHDDTENDEHQTGAELNTDGRAHTEAHIDSQPLLSPSPKLKIKLGRGRTHNEQILVAPCGIIIACATFYGAEAIPSVVVSNLQESSFDANTGLVEKTYHSFRAPNHLVYDSNCLLSKHVKAQKNKMFKNL